MRTVSENGNHKDDVAPATQRVATYQNPEEELEWRYANSVSVGMSIWDMRIRFAFAVVANDEVLKLRDVASIILSPQHAKALADLLNTRLNKYEEQFGPLPDVHSTIRES
jgi:hypothetical protein